MALPLMREIAEEATPALRSHGRRLVHGRAARDRPRPWSRSRRLPHRAEAFAARRYAIDTA